MAKRMSEEDYFKSTTMTFGEHLEELRKVLVRAVLGLAVGFCIGLLFATYVVQFIQTPLVGALENYYTERELIEMKKKYGDEAVTEEVRKFVSERNIAMSIIFLEESEAARLAQELNFPAANKPPASGTANQASANPPPATNVDDAPLQEVTDNLPPPRFQGRMFPARIWLPVRAKVTTLSAQEAFMIWIKAALICGIIIASPYMFYQIWSFVAAGLYPHEQKHVRVYLPFSLGLFLLGASTAFFLVFEPVLSFLFKFNLSMNIDPDPRISEWIGFVLILPIGFGIAFQLPLVMLFLHRVGIMSIQAYIDKWRIAVLVIFVMSAVLTPADPISMLAMAVPLTFLYYLGIGLCRWMPAIKNPVPQVAE